MIRFFANVLEKIGIKKPKQVKILILGLDNAGKTTLLYVLADEKQKQLYGRDYIQLSIRLNNLAVKAKELDLGPYQPHFKRVMEAYFNDIDAVLYLVDSSDHERFDESQALLQMIIKYTEQERTPILVMGNKIDRPSAVTTEELLEVFRLDEKEVTDKISRVKLFMMSIVKRMGYKQGFMWLEKQIPF